MPKLKKTQEKSITCCQRTQTGYQTQQRKNNTAKCPACGSDPVFSGELGFPEIGNTTSVRHVSTGTFGDRKTSAAERCEDDSTSLLLL